MSERACSFTILLASVIASVLASACSADATHDGTDQPAMELRFDARMGQAAFACGGVLPHVGTSALVAEPLDLRLYVHDVKLLRENGEQVAFELAPDEQWQSTRVALLDFEDGSGRRTAGRARHVVELAGRLQIPPRRAFDASKPRRFLVSPRSRELRGIAG